MTTTIEKTIKAEVFVMTKANFGSSAHGNQGKWFDLTEFTNRDDFLIAAKKYITEELGSDDAPYISNHNVSFNTLGLIDEPTIKSALWSLLALDDQEKIDIVCHFVPCYGFIDGDMTETIEQALDRFHGKFDTELDAVEHYVYKQSWLDFVAPEIKNSIDMDVLSEKVMKRMKSKLGYYYTNA